MDLTRRHLLGGITAGLAVAGTAGTAVTPAQAARVRTVTKYVAVKYKYDPATGVTKVTKRRVREVTARFVGKKVFEKRHGRWVRVPYLWDQDKHALVYSRRLHLKLLAHKRPGDKKTLQQPDPPQPPGATEPPGTTQPPQYPGDPAVIAASPYALADAAHHVLNRVGYGVSKQSLRDVADAGGARAWLRAQLQPQSVDDSACETYLRRLPDQADPIRTVAADIRAGRREGWQELNWVNTGMIVRATWSRRQLLASLEEFWGNHFNVSIPHDGVDASRAHYQHTIRRHALGRFEDLLFATATHTAMLTYLNNRDSDDEHPNENQGRELLELHTVGLEAGYTENDVLNSARILTGLTVDDDEEFVYQPGRHWAGAVRVLGFSHANATRDGGLDVFRQYVRYLAAHPSTARRICTKLARWFVSDSPAPGYLDGLVAQYQRTDGSITAILEAIFGSDEFWASVGGKTRRPFDAAIAAMRRLGVTPADGLDGLDAITWTMGNIGQAPFGAPYPTGWPDAPQAWMSPAAALNRWNQTMALTAGWTDSVVEPDLKEYLFGGATLPATHGEAIDAIGVQLFGMAPLASHKQALLTFLDRNSASPANASSAVYGWRLPYVVAMLLDSPYLVSR